MNALNEAEVEGDIRLLRDDEMQAASGAFLGLLIGAGLFGVGFLGGVVACNVVNDRPWYEF